jgi:hypothetical protein
MQGLEGEAVLFHSETRHNAADAVRPTCPKGKSRRQFIERDSKMSVGGIYELSEKIWAVNISISAPCFQAFSGNPALRLPWLR